jgi:bacteriorhodopsin
MMVMMVLPVFILIALIASLPIWPHSKKWGFYPISAVSVIILIVLFLFWTGRFPHR